MQRVRGRFRDKDGGVYGSLQSCIRTTDLELVGDGVHLTSFGMIGNFSFGGPPYEVSVGMWDSIVRELGLPVSEVTFHPSRLEHGRLWESLGYKTRPEIECVWSDGEIGGNCCELFVGSLEIGNLVNPLGDCTDVGFGFERILQVMERRDRVDETSIFGQGSPVVRDHRRTLSLMRKNDVKPGPKGREYICRRLVRRCMDDGLDEFDDWVESERKIRDNQLKQVKRCWKKHKDKPPEWWRETFGILPEDLGLLK